MAEFFTCHKHGRSECASIDAMENRKVLIIGSGPAGLTAAIYAGRANLKPLVISGPQPGGQLMITTEVENYPGFPDGILGPELMQKFRTQAERFGSVFVEDAVSEVNFKEYPFRVKAGDTVYSASSVIIASGASSLWLGLPGEQELVGRGISACATCDGFFFKDKEVIVVGGGDSAMEESLFLTKFVKSVTIVYRGDQLRASKIMQDRAKSNPKIVFVYNSVVDEIIGQDRLEAVKLRNTKNGEVTERRIDGMFIAIGHKPNTEIFKDQIELDVKGYVTAKDHTSTSVEGVFVAGDVHDHRYRQAVTAAGLGCMAAIDAERWLEQRG